MIKPGPLGGRIPAYNESLAKGEQTKMEKKLAAIVRTHGVPEEECAEVGKALLQEVLWKFRKDLFESKGKEKKHGRA